MRAKQTPRWLRAGLIGTLALLLALAALGAIPGLPSWSSASSSAWAEALGQADPAPPASAPPSGLVNLSTRGHVGSDRNPLIAGLIVQAGAVTVALRALGPSLADAGLTGLLEDPQIGLRTTQLEDPSASPPEGPIDNDDWRDAPNADEIERAGMAPGDPRESVILTTLQPGEHTLLVWGRQTEGTRLALVEVFLMGGAGELVNLSTRGQVATTDQRTMIGGFIIRDRPATVILRGRGPSLPSDLVDEPLADPKLEFFRHGNRFSTNESWMDMPEAAALVRRGLDLDDEREPAMLLDLPPGEYTAVMRGHPPDAADWGTGLLEVFAGPPLRDGEANLIQPRIVNTILRPDEPHEDLPDHVWRNVYVLIENPNVVGLRRQEHETVIVRDEAGGVIAQPDLWTLSAGAEHILPARSTICSRIRYSRRLDDSQAGQSDRYEAYWRDLNGSAADNLGLVRLRGLEISDTRLEPADAADVGPRHVFSLTNRSDLDVRQLIVNAAYRNENATDGTCLNSRFYELARDERKALGFRLPPLDGVKPVHLEVFGMPVD